MKNKILILMLGFFIGSMIPICSYAQQKGEKKAASAKFKMTTPVPEGIEIPDQVNSRLGTLKFFDGFPDDATVEKLYDNLDFQRAVQAYLLGLPAVNMAAYRKGITGVGPANITIATFEELMDSHTLWLTANCNTPFTWMWLDLRNGPVVSEVPPGVLGMYNDAWGRFVDDAGILGPDKGQGGKYLALPPGYDGPVPTGYFIVKSPTFGCAFAYRHFAVSGDFKPAMERLKKYARVYMLSQANNPPTNTFVDVSGREFSTVAPGDYRFWDYLNEVVQDEPVESSDRVSLGYMASIGIEKGKRFDPDARMKKILADAAVVGDATARAITYRMRQKENYFYEHSAWRRLFLGGSKFETQPGILNLDGYAYFYFMLMGNSPAEEIEIVDKGSQYVMATLDADGNPLDGRKTYMLHLPPDCPVKDFWSLIVYDCQTRSWLQTDQQYPMVTSQNRELFINPDKSVDVYFGPAAPAGKENNWIQTIPRKGWFTILRLYGPGKAWFEKTWRPGEIELINK